MALAPFHPAVREWFSASFEAPTEAQAKGWAAIARGESTLLLAPTGSGKTLAAFLWCINRLMFEPADSAPERRASRVLYVSPLKALAVDVERNLRAPIAGIANAAARRGDRYRAPSVTVRTGDTPASERARFQREPADIVITTPESLYLLLTSNAREAFRDLDTLIIDEIHALVPTKRGAHLALSVERLAHFTAGTRQTASAGLAGSHLGPREAAVDLFDGGANRLATRRVGGRLELGREVRARKTEVFVGSMFLGVGDLSGGAAALLVLARIHLLLQPGFSVDKSLTCITHDCSCSLSCRPARPASRDVTR